MFCGHDPEIITVPCNKQYIEEEILAPSYHNQMSNCVSNSWQIGSVFPFVLKKNTNLSCHPMLFQTVLSHAPPQILLQCASSELLQLLKSTLYSRLAEVTYPRARIAVTTLDPQAIQHPKTTLLQSALSSEHLSWPTSVLAEQLASSTTMSWG